jgi:hypothetical protein
MIDLNIKVTPVGDLYINGQYYRQLCFDGVAIGMAIFIGIKYLTKGAGAKAEVKDTVLPFLIGAILVGGATTIAKFALTLAG